MLKMRIHVLIGSLPGVKLYRHCHVIFEFIVNDINTCR